MIGSILGILEAALSIWASKEATKYIDQVSKLRTQYYEEDSKPAGSRNDALLDSIRFQLCNLADGVAAEIAAEKAKA